MEWHPSANREVVGHVLPCSCVLGTGPGLNICPSELPCLDALRTEDFSVDGFEFVPLVIGPLPVEGVHEAAMIEARKGFLDPSTRGVVSSLLLSAPIGLVRAVTGIGLVWPLSERDWRDIAPSCGREGYVVSPKRGERVSAAVGGRVEPSPSPRSGQCRSGDVGRRGIDVFVFNVNVVPGKGTGSVLLILSNGSFSVSWFPGARGVVGVVIGIRRRSIALWVC